MKGGRGVVDTVRAARIDTRKIVVPGSLNELQRFGTAGLVGDEGSAVDGYNLVEDC